MSKTAKELWAEAGFNFSYDCEAGIVYSDIFESDVYLGANRIEIDKDGSFRGGITRPEDSGYPFGFSPAMSKALVQQLKEFNII